MHNSLTHIKCLSESKEFLSQGNFSTQNSNSHKCLPAIDRANKAIHGSSVTFNEVLAKSISQKHHWVHVRLILLESQNFSKQKFCVLVHFITYVAS